MIYLSIPVKFTLRLSDSAALTSLNFIRGRLHRPARLALIIDIIPLEERPIFFSCLVCLLRRNGKKDITIAVFATSPEVAAMLDVRGINSQSIDSLPQFYQDLTDQDIHVFGSTSNSSVINSIGPTFHHGLNWEEIDSFIRGTNTAVINTACEESYNRFMAEYQILAIPQETKDQLMLNFRSLVLHRLFATIRENAHDLPFAAIHTALIQLYSGFDGTIQQLQRLSIEVILASLVDVENKLQALVDKVIIYLMLNVEIVQLAYVGFPWIPDPYACWKELIALRLSLLSLFIFHDLVDMIPHTNHHPPYFDSAMKFAFELDTHIVNLMNRLKGEGRTAHLILASDTIRTFHYFIEMARQGLETNFEEDDENGEDDDVDEEGEMKVFQLMHFIYNLFGNNADEIAVNEDYYTRLESVFLAGGDY